MALVSWRRSWTTALYGECGFYRQAGPAAHFTTATHGPTGPVLASALLELAAREACTQVVDLGCGRGELLRAMRTLDPRIMLTGIDIVARPPDLPDDISWLVSPGGAALPDDLVELADTLVVAHEWLDVVPCTIAEVVDGEKLRDMDGLGLREVLVDEHGAESLGDELGAADLVWVDRHWPVAGAVPGDRVEVGLTRDRAWDALLQRIRSGVAVAVDYGHRHGERPTAGTLAAYRRGVGVVPVPDGTCDLTAHVAMDSLTHDRLLTQREALRELGVSAATPPHALARTDPAAYLAGLEVASAAGSLMALGGFGDFLWAVKRVG